MHRSIAWLVAGLSLLAHVHAWADATVRIACQASRWLDYPAESRGVAHDRDAEMTVNP